MENSELKDLLLCISKTAFCVKYCKASQIRTRMKRVLTDLIQEYCHTCKYKVIWSGYTEEDGKKVMGLTIPDFSACYHNSGDAVKSLNRLIDQYVEG